ncbi:protein DpdD [Corallincola platygyrae]|uniref:Protein DpdD n=1 Tax=Corallincola platygyrae TaxID=1193278 RepID=A0ABW4XIN6_9GAMM
MKSCPDWITQFYNCDDKINLQSVLSGFCQADDQAVLEPLLLDAFEGQWPCILPSSKERLWFYALAQDERTLLELKRVLAAFLGSADTYPDLPVITRPTDPAEQILLAQAPSGVIKFCLLEPREEYAKAQQRVVSSLVLMLQLFKRRPELTSTARRPVGRILRDFFTACHAKDGGVAKALLDELRTNGSLSQRNLLFLELQVLAASQKWSEILYHHKLPDLMAGRVPQRLYRLLLRALGHLILDQIQSDGFSPETLPDARFHCQGLCPLFLCTPPLENHASFAADWKLWAMGSAALGFTPWDRLPDFVEASWQRLAQAWAGCELSDSKSLSDTRTAVVVSDDTLVPATLPVLALSLDNAKQLLQRTLMAEAQEQAEIVETLRGMPGETESALAAEPHLVALWQSLKDQYDSSSYGWCDWLAELTAESPNLAQLRQKVLTFSSQWAVKSFSDSALLNLLESTPSDDISSVLRDSLPLLIDWLEQANVYCQGEVWSAWLELMALDTIVSDQDVRLAGLLLDKLLADSFATETYISAIQCFEAIFEKSSSVRAYGYSLDIIDQLLDTSCPDHVLIEKLWRQILITALKSWSRLEPAQQALSRLLAVEIQGQEALEQFPQEDNDSASDTLLPDLFGKRLVIYSLTEGAARRAAQAIGGMFSQLTIDLNHDHVATASLQNLAGKADYFIFAWGSSKHQAFNAVTKIRRDLIYPQGKGSSSIVNAFLEAIS